MLRRHKRPQYEATLFYSQTHWLIGWALLHHSCLTDKQIDGQTSMFHKNVGCWAIKAEGNELPTPALFETYFKLSWPFPWYVCIDICSSQFYLWCRLNHHPSFCISWQHLRTAQSARVFFPLISPFRFYSAQRLLTWVTYKDPVRTAQETLSVSVTKTNQLMLYREIIAVCSEIHTKHVSKLCGQNVELLNVKLVVHIVTNGLIIGKFTLVIA